MAIVPSRPLASTAVGLVAFSLLAGCTTSGEKASSTAPATPPVAVDALIPRDVLFGNPDRSQARLSPDGKRLAWLQPVNGVMNVWVAPANNINAAKPVTSDANRGIRQYFWAFTSNDLLYLQDKGGDENWKIFRVDLASGDVKDLTPFESIAGPDGKPIMLPSGKPMRPTAQVEGVSEKFPDTIIIGLNNRNPQLHDLFSANVRTGKLTKILENPGFIGFQLDDDYAVRFASSMTPTGAVEVKINTSSNAAPQWETWDTIPSDDALTTGPIGFDRTGKKVFMRESRGRDTSALVEVDIATKQSRVVAQNAKADVGGVIMHPVTKNVQAASFNYLRNEWTVLDESIKPDLAFLATVNPGEVNITSRSLDDSRWTVAFLQDNGPTKTYLFDRPTRKATYLFSNKRDLEGLALTTMHPVVIKSRDGLNLVSYLSLPAGSFTPGDTRAGGVPRPNKALPLILNVHGGPWARDTWGYDPEHQWLANRGYAVLSVNFRGSTGFGKNFIAAGNREWAGKMHDDLLDAVNWAVANGIADKDKVAIYGGSYGGYAALVGATFTPDVFACAVSVVGPSNIVTLLNSIPPYWAPMISMFTTRVGDITSDEGRKFLESRSPLTFVDRIKRPLLIGQGANDPRVKQAESDQIVSAMKTKNIPVTYVLFPDEGHGFARPENRIAFYAVTEAFFAQHLGGKFEPVGDDFKGSSVQVPEGRGNVPGLEGALKTISR